MGPIAILGGIAILGKLLEKPKLQAKITDQASGRTSSTRRFARSLRQGRSGRVRYHEDGRVGDDLDQPDEPTVSDRHQEMTVADMYVADAAEHIFHHTCLTTCWGKYNAEKARLANTVPTMDEQSHLDKLHQACRKVRKVYNQGTKDLAQEKEELFGWYGETTYDELIDAVARAVREDMEAEPHQWLTSKGLHLRVSMKSLLQTLWAQLEDERRHGLWGQLRQPSLT